MLIPAIQSRMIQPSQFVGLRVISSNIRSFIAVALQASQAKIVVCIFTAMANGDDMVNMKVGGLFAYSDKTIFTAPQRLRTNCATLPR